MWNRDEKVRPLGTGANPAPAPFEPSVMPGGYVRERIEHKNGGEEVASIGKSIGIKGELSGGEDPTIEGEVEGKIELRDHVLTVGTNGRIKAQITAKSIVVQGHVAGNLIATQKVDIQESGSVEGDVVAPRVAIADGSHFKGSIDMQRKESLASERAAGRSKHEAKAPIPVVAPMNDQLASA